MVWSGDPLDVLSRVERAFLGGREVYTYDTAAGVGTYAEHGTG